ncbi:MAG: hypothetical protein M1826_005797 [Phylliscum demangeonii]|nr:MAG: hypothetical protein M1826_005797 [Phylliscum demangeonii]
MAQSSAGPALTAHEALSGLSGSISLAAWIFVLVPQLVENYKNGSADGVSLASLLVWFLGDMANLSGAIWAGLVPTVVALAAYFCLADAITVTQCFYYNHINARRKALLDDVPSTGHASHLEEDDEEEQPLLRSMTADSLALPGSRRRSSTYGSAHARDSLLLLPPSLEAKDRSTPEWVNNTIGVLLVGLVGTAGWLVAWQTGVWTPTAVGGRTGSSVKVAWGPQVLGYLSACFYLGARIPQIIKNHRDRSCEGLALLFFILSVLGNVSYAGGILFHSLERGYLLLNLPWLLGSLGTVVQDVVIFVQFRIYSTANSAVQ